MHFLQKRKIKNFSVRYNNKTYNNDKAWSRTQPVKRCEEATVWLGEQKPESGNLFFQFKMRKSANWAKNTHTHGTVQCGGARKIIHGASFGEKTLPLCLSGLSATEFQSTGHDDAAAAAAAAVHLLNIQVGVDYSRAHTQVHTHAGYPPAHTHTHNLVM